MIPLYKVTDKFYKVIEVNPSDTAYFKRGCVYLALMNNRAAIMDFNKTIKLNPNFAMAYYKRAIALLFSSTKKAVKNLDKAIELKVENMAMAYYIRGGYKFSLSNYKEALEDYDKSLSLDSNYSLLIILAQKFITN